MNNNEASLKAQIQQKDVLIQIQNTKIQQQDIDIKKLEKRISEKEDYIQELDKSWICETKKKNSLLKIVDMYREILIGEEERTEKYLQRLKILMNLGYSGLIPSFPDELLHLMKKCESIEQFLKKLKSFLNALKAKDQFILDIKEFEELFYSVYNVIKKKYHFELKVDDSIQYISDEGLITEGKICRILPPTLLISDNNNKSKKIPLHSLVYHKEGGFLKHGTLQIGQRKLELITLLGLEVEHHNNLCSEDYMPFEYYCIP